MAKGHPTSEILDRMPPCDKAAEDAVLGSIMLKPSVLKEVRPRLDAEAFYVSGNQVLYHVLDALGVRAGDAALIVDALRKGGLLAAVDGKPRRNDSCTVMDITTARIAEIAQSVPYAANWPYYVEIVMKAYAKRQLFHAGAEILRDVFDDTLDAGALLARWAMHHRRLAFWMAQYGLLEKSG